MSGTTMNAEQMQQVQMMALQMMAQMQQNQMLPQMDVSNAFLNAGVPSYDISQGEWEFTGPCEEEEEDSKSPDDL